MPSKFTLSRPIAQSHLDVCSESSDDDFDDFHIPEYHILLIINRWSQKRHSLNVCDIIIKYTYILPKILFGLQRKISPGQSRSSISLLPKTNQFQNEYDIIKPLTTIKGFFGQLYLCSPSNDNDNDNYVCKTLTHSEILSSIISKKQRKTLGRMIIDDMDTVSIVNHDNILSIKELYRSQTNSIVVVPHCEGFS